MEERGESTLINILKYSDNNQTNLKKFLDKRNVILTKAIRSKEVYSYIEYGILLKTIYNTLISKETDLIPDDDFRAVRYIGGIRDTFSITYESLAEVHIRRKIFKHTGISLNEWLAMSDDERNSLAKITLDFETEQADELKRILAEKENKNASEENSDNE